MPVLLCVDVVMVGISGAGSLLTSDVWGCFFVCLCFFLEVVGLASIASSSAGAREDRLAKSSFGPVYAVIAENERTHTDIRLSCRGP